MHHCGISIAPTASYDFIVHSCWCVAGLRQTGHSGLLLHQSQMHFQQNTCPHGVAARVPSVRSVQARSSHQSPHRTFDEVYLDGTAGSSSLPAE